MKEWFNAAELAGLPGLPGTEQRVRSRAQRKSWSRNERQGRGGGWVYHLSALPVETQAALLLRGGEPSAVSPQPSAKDEARSAALWAVFDRKPEKFKERAAYRLRLVQAVERLAASGTPKLKAIAVVAREAGESAGTLRRWVDLVAEVEPQDRLPALAPRWSGRTATAECSVEAWDYFKADYMRPERPCAEACYDRLTRAAGERGWSVPSLATLRRRLQRELHPGAVVLAREGVEAAKRRYPAQERDRAVFRALEAVNADGHKFDVFVRFPAGPDGKEEIARPVMVAWQDLYSGKVLTWRVARTECAELVRLSFADAVERWGIPARAWFDNGRGFASKWITGGAPTRYRFKVKPEDPAGVMTLLGVEVHWTQPYWGQAKPIERAFRDLCEYVAKHPALAGAYCGNAPDAKPENYGSRAVPLTEFLGVLDQEMAAHNARPGRRSDVAAGRSFDQVFAESYATAGIRKATEQQRRLLLLAAEGVTADRTDAAIRLFGNRYWADDVGLARLAGRKVIVRFDPQDLTKAVHVYAADGRYVATAARIEKAGFDDVEAARAHAHSRKAWVKAQKTQVEAERRMTALEAAALLPAPKGSGAAEAKVVRPLFGAVHRQGQGEEISREEAEERFARGIELLRRREGLA